MHLGVWYRPLAVVSVLGCGLLLVICMWPPNELSIKITAAAVGLLTVCWFAFERHRFQGPPVGRAIEQRQAAIADSESRSHIVESIIPESADQGSGSE